MTGLQTGGAGFDDLDPDPVTQFRRWLADAESSRAIREPTAMAIATVGGDGRPSARMVLIRRFDEHGFCFFTDYESQKGRELAHNPWAAAVVYWDPLARQVRISGQVERTSQAESDAYYAARAPGSRIAAWASRQSRPIADRAALERRYAVTERRFAGGDVPRPPNWGGFRLVPRRFEFWQSRENRLHDRLAYELGADGTWQRQRLMS
jgi:pyridoxamine 5'-phosphate oxidase